MEEKKTKNKKRRDDRGFTLIEMMVSVALFAVVMLIAGATLLSLVYANRKAEALQSVMNNLNISLDDMVRNVRMGTNYRCGTDQSAETESDGDCSGGGTILYFTPFEGIADDRAQDDWAYVFDTSGAFCGVNELCENQNGLGWYAITAPEVQIQNMTFYVVGTEPGYLGGTSQSKVLFTLQGRAGTASAKTVTSFEIQGTAVQRQLNL